MVKRGKKKDKSTGNSLEEVFGGGSKSGWQTSSAMMVDDGEPGTVPVEGSKSKAASQAGSVKDMDCSEGVPRAGRATTHVPGLGVVTHSCKRGDHTTKQKKRKVKKLVKAVARAGRVAVRIDTKEKIKQNKIARKNVY